jgi:hypothetical protein
MEKEFVTYEQALALKELGIYIPPPCYSVYRKYNNVGAFLLINAESMETIDLVAPLKVQVFRWFRDMYGAHIHPRRILPNVYIAEYGLWTSEAFKTYEGAENACIDKLIEIAKQNKI